MAELSKTLNQLADDVNALKDAGYDTSDAGRGNKAVTEKSTSQETGDSSSQASQAAHDARDDMEEDGSMGIPADRHGGS